MASFRCILSLAGQDFPVVHCAYEFNQSTSERGRVAAKVRSGIITMHLDVPDGDQLLAWAADPHKKHSGFITFQQTDRPIAREVLGFEDGFCVAYEEIFVAGSNTAGAYQCILRISAAKLTMGTTEKDSAWVQTR